VGVALAVLCGFEKLIKILPSFHTQADLTVSQAGHPAIWGHLALRKAALWVPKPLRAP